MLGLTFSCKLDWHPYIISVAKTVYKKNGALIHCKKFLSPELFCISINLTYGPVWNTVVTSGLVPLVAPWNCSLAACLELLAHCWNVARLSFFHRYYFGRCSSELTQLVPLPFSWWRSTHYSDRWHDFSVTIPRCYKDVYVDSFFPCTARPWNSLSIECFLLIYDLSGFRSRINIHLLTVGSF